MYNAHHADTLSSRSFQRLASFIEGYSGIRMPPNKKTMVEGRLRRRVRMLGVPSLDDYCRQLFEDGLLETEVIPLINAVTTNKTDFLREEEHFNFLRHKVLPAWTRGRERIGVDRPLRLWCAASSTGAEPYTLAMMFDEFGRQTGGLRHKILATDICTDVLDVAKRAIYPAEMLAPVPAEWQRRYFLRSRHSNRATVRLIPEIRQSVLFGRLNLMDETYPIDDLMDVVFCRNILIYFDKKTQQQVLSRICDRLRPGGLLFISHTETVAGLHLPVKPVSTSVFERT
jgi:chemotaxis protein methyltransferase CheR